MNTAQLLLTINFTCGAEHQDGMLQVHDSAEKRQFFSSVEVFDVTLVAGSSAHTWNTSTGSAGLFLCCCQE